MNKLEEEVPEQEERAEPEEVTEPEESAEPEQEAEPEPEETAEPEQEAEPEPEESAEPEQEAEPEPEETAEPEQETEPEKPRRIPLPPVKALLFPFLFWWAGILLCELVIRVAELGSMDRFPLVILFSAAAAALIAALTTFPKLAGKVISWIVPAVLYLIYAVQLVYHYVFNTFVSLIYVSEGGNAITQFFDIVIDAILHCIPGLLIMAVPPAAFYVLRHRGWLVKKEGGVKVPLILLACAAVFSTLSVLSLSLGGTGAGTSYGAFHSASATVDRWAEHFGLFTAEALDLKRLVVGGGSGPASDVMDLTAGGHGARNVLSNLDFGALEKQTDKPELQTLSRYFASLDGTNQNDYTGMFEGYNLIEICAESFSPYVVDPELTPTLYRLTHEGIVFENFYNSFPDVTSDGEYSLCMGMMINLKRVSFASSMDNYVPYCMGNMFSSIGVPAYAYHNNYAVYYNRINTHPNMGYDFRGIGSGLDMETGHPSSDLEMFQKTVDDYIGEEQFHAYYMTYSGHFPYTFEKNQIAQKNAALVADMDLSDPARAYYCGQLELEKAMTYLVQRLEDAGIADRTVIVLTGDHYPYALPEESYAELAGDAVKTNPFWRFRNAFVCWSGAVKEPVVVDDYCCTQDILPTMLNLFGFSYDSRMLTGRDVLSDCAHFAMLKNGSVLCKDFLYQSDSGEMIWQKEDHGRQDEEAAQDLIQAVENLFTIAADVLDHDYYQFAFSSLGLSEGREEQPIEVSFFDTKGTYYEEAANLLVREGIIFITNGGNFAGERTLTRGEAIAMVGRWLGLSGDPKTLPYTDIVELKDDWYAEPLAGLLEAGLLPDMEGKTEAQALTPLPTEEAVDFLSRVAEHIGHPDAGAWAEDLVETAMEKQIASGADVPADCLTRGSIACILADMIAYVNGPSA